LARDDDLGILKLSRREPCEEVLEVDLDELDVLALVAAALARFVGAADLCAIEEDPLRGAPGRGEECRYRIALVT
jgi:hypothetical protein